MEIEVLTTSQLKRLKKYQEEDIKISKAVKVINKAVQDIIDETNDEDVKYEVGKAWGITKEYLNVK
jgi:hypothetical protein